MTKEEYEKLLRSDYWKGFSYSIIKERNFTCEDCGKRFYNQRNKLQVHHLVYRDINPWSYKPEEMLVLCEDCHKKRHNLYVYKPADDTFKEKGRALILNIWCKLKYWFGKRRFRKRFFLFIVAVLGLLLYSKMGNYIQDNAQDKKETIIEEDNSKEKKIKVRSKSKKSKRNKDKEEKVEENNNDVVNEEEVITFDEGLSEVTPSEPAETPEMTKKEAKKYNKAVKKAIKAGVSTEGTTEEILERIKQAKAAKKAEKKAQEITIENTEE